MLPVSDQLVHLGFDQEPGSSSGPTRPGTTALGAVSALEKAAATALTPFRRRPDEATGLAFPPQAEAGAGQVGWVTRAWSRA